MNKLTKLGIVTFSAVTLSAVVPTLVHAEENVAPQPNVAVKPNTAQPTPAPKPAENPQPEVKPTEQPQPTQPVKPAENKPVENKPAETPVPAPKPAENPQPEVKPAEQPQPANSVKPAENAGLPKIPYRKDQPKRWFNGAGRPTLTTNDLAAPLPTENVEKTSYGWWTAEPDLLHAGSHIKVNTFNSNFNNPMFENGKEIKFKGSGFGDMDSRFKPALVRVKVPELEGMNYEAYTIFYEVPNKNGNPTYGTNRTLQGGGIVLNIKSKEKKEDIQVYTLTKDRKLEELYYPGFPSEETNRYDEKTKTHSYNLYGETYDTYVFLFKNPAEKPAEQVKPEVKPNEQPKPAENKPVENKPAETPVPAPKPAENPQPEVKPVEQPQPANPVKPAENVGLPKIPYRTNNPKRWFNGAGRPTLTTNDLAIPLPTENVEKTSYGWWTAEPDLLHAGSHIKTSTFSSNFNVPMFENGKEINFKDGFKDMDSRFRPALVRVKVPELEGTNYEAYTIFYEVPNKNGNPTYGTNQTLQSGNVALTFKSKEKKEDIQVYTLTKDRKLEELYFSGYPREDINRYDEKTKTHLYRLPGETYRTYVFLFKNPAEKPAEQVKPEVKPSEQPKPDKQPVPIVPAEQPQPAKPEKPAVKPSENPVNPVTPVAPVIPTTPVTPTLNPATPNNTRVLSNKAGSVRVHGSEATLKNVSYIKVEETKPTSLESKDYKAFDIHLYDANGKAIQPNGMVLVSLSADKPVENVYYVAPDGTLQALKFKQDTDKVTFETNHFSIYAMTFKVAASRDNGGTTIPVPVVNSNNTPTTTEQKGNDVSSTKTQAEPLATKTETISKQVDKTLPNTGENHSILATLFGMLTLTAGLFSFRKESE